MRFSIDSKKSKDMRRMIIMMALALGYVLSASAQDRIYMNDSRVIDAIVDEVSDTYVYYRFYGNPNGPACSASVYNIIRIVYANGEEQTFSGTPYYDERILLDERMQGLLGGKPLKMRYDSGNLYLGSRSRYGAMQADYIAFNLYGDEYFAARNNRKWGASLVWLGCMTASSGIFLFCASVPEGGALLTGIGAASLGVGIPLMQKGNKKLKGIAADYNASYANEKSAELTFGPCRNGVGFALNF